MTPSPKSLREYQSKRNFDRTAEPGPKEEEPLQALRFVVQKHEARRLHYDFRLELDGVLLSWAVPKGPSIDPSIRRLAVHVEDHPLEYRNFEGTIPKGEYGGGTVMIWDFGLWFPEGDNPREDYEKGKLSFRLEGQRLKGSWRLVRTDQGDDGKHWLLIKQKDSHAHSHKNIQKDSRSAISGRSMQAIRENPDEPQSIDKELTMDLPVASEIPKAVKKKMPSNIKPQLATLSNKLPAGDDWIYEVKYDGYRLISFIQSDQIRLQTRNGNDWTDRFPGLAVELRQFGSDLILDGEIVAINTKGQDDFQILQASLKEKVKGVSLVYYVFDILYYDGYDLQKTPLIHRKECLKDLLQIFPSDMLQFSKHIDKQSKEFWRFACQSALEGVICKKKNARYKQERSADWIKVKCLNRQEFVIGGYTEPGGRRTGFGALLLGVYDDQDRLRYCGRVGTGFTRSSLEMLSDKLESRIRKESPFVNPPDDEDVHWTQPDLVAEVEFREWTQMDRLRQPSFKGLREDKKPHQIHRETPSSTITEEQSPQAPKAEAKKKPRDSKSNVVGGVVISNPNKVLYPEQEVSKMDLAKYYDKVADFMLPHLMNRPLMVMRCPKGADEECFYQKHADVSLPDSVKSIELSEKNKKREYIYIDDKVGLLSLVQMGTLEFHPWGSRVDKPEAPDRLIFDLDPAEGVPWEKVAESAKRLRDLLGALELRGFLRSTGGKGLHVVFPIRRMLDWETVKSFSAAIVQEIVSAYPKEYVGAMTKKARQDKIFIDYFRNARGATAIASYSTRARKGAPVAAPLSWDEIEGQEEPKRYTIDTMPPRLAALEKDPWEDFLKIQQTLTARALRAMKVR